MPFTLNERHLSPDPFAHEHADRSPGRRLAASSSVHPHVTSSQRIPAPGLGGRCPALQSWCWGTGGGRAGVLPSPVLCRSCSGWSALLCGGAEERGLPSSQPCTARLDTALRSPGTGMRNRALRAVGDELARPKKPSGGHRRGQPYRIPAPLLPKSLPPRLCRAVFLIGAGKVYVKAQGLP